ncbi:MAG: cyclase family protein [Clostridia bacterium]
MKQNDVIDLSQPLYSGEEANFKFELELRDAKLSMPELSYDDDIWYKIGYVKMCTHNSTHVEVPYHHLSDGTDLLSMPLCQLMGNLVVMDFTNKTPADFITLEALKSYDSVVHKGDIVFVKTHMDKLFRTEDWAKYPYISIEGIHWFIEKGIACLGTDAAGIEDILAHNQPGHITLFKGGIPLVESLTNLDKVETGKYMAFVLPLPIHHGDASPVRVVAVSKEALLAELKK